MNDPVVPEEWVPPPGPAAEIQCNGVDEDLDGVDKCSGDADKDGVVADHDCDDLDSSRYPGNVEVLCDGKDQNCDGVDTCDRDHDGFIDSIDCEPTDPTITDECREVPPGVPGL